MSGGSYEYLCYKDEAEIRDHPHTLEEMADRLAKLDYAQDAAKETSDLLETLYQLGIQAQATIDRLSDVWHAVEWWDSGDWVEDDVKEALAKYRGEIS